MQGPHGHPLIIRMDRIVEGIEIGKVDHHEIDFSVRADIRAPLLPGRIAYRLRFLKQVRLMYIYSYDDKADGRR